MKRIFALAGLMAALAAPVAFAAPAGASIAGASLSQTYYHT